MTRWFLSLILMLPFGVTAADLTPWFGRDKMIEIHPWVAYQYVPTLDTNLGTIHRATNNAFVGTNASICTDNQYALEAGLSLFRTRVTSFTFEQGNITLRYKLLNDIVGDLCSLVVGATVQVPSQRAVRDYNTIYHGKVEVELHAAIGKEYSCGAFYDSRWWGAVALGKADRGRPWLRAFAVWEKNFFNLHQWRLFATGAGGFGRQALSLAAPFNGYSQIAYRLVDIGAGYTFLIDECGKTLSVEYSLSLIHI